MDLYCFYFYSSALNFRRELHDPGLRVLTEVVKALPRRFTIHEDHLVTDQELDAVQQVGFVDLDLGGDAGLAEHDLLVFGLGDGDAEALATPAIPLSFPDVARRPRIGRGICLLGGTGVRSSVATNPGSAGPDS